MYQSIKPGKVWLDTEGKRIQAHGLSVFFKEQSSLLQKNKNVIAMLYSQ